MWERDWTTYMVKARLAEKPDEGRAWPQVDPEVVKAHRQSVLENWEAHVHRLPNPIVVENSVKEILPVRRGDKTCRAYPPFPLSNPGEISGAFNGVSIPEGVDSIELHTELPKSAVKGLAIEPYTFEDATFCSGVRLDVETGFPEQEVLKSLLDHVVQYTHQWWLRAPEAPFRGSLRMGAAIDREYKLVNELRYRGAENLESTWHGMGQTQRIFGFERPLTKGIWLLCIHNIQNNIPAEVGFLAFADALSHYKAGDDERCILDLAITFEILATKRLMVDTGKAETSIKKLLNKTVLATGQTALSIDRLIIDRNHVAHGRPPYILGNNPDVTLEIYLEAVRNVVSQYLSLVQPGEWPELAAIKLKSTRRR